MKQYTAIKTDKNNPELMFVCEDRDSFGKMQARVYDIERGVKVYEHSLSDVKCVEFKGKCIFSLLGTGEVVINDIRGWEGGGAGRMEGRISRVGLKTNEYAPGWSHLRGAWLKIHGGRCYYSMANGPIYATQNILKRMKDAGEETTTTTTAALSFKSQHIFEDMNPINCLVEFHGDIMVTINWDSFGTGSGVRMTKIKTYDLKEGGSRGVLSEFDVHGLSNFGNGPVKMQIDDTKIIVLFSRAVSGDKNSDTKVIVLQHLLGLITTHTEINHGREYDLNILQLPPLSGGNNYLAIRVEDFELVGGDRLFVTLALERNEFDKWNPNPKYNIRRPVRVQSSQVRVYDLNSHDADKTSYKGLMEALHEKWRKKERLCQSLSAASRMNHQQHQLPSKQRQKQRQQVRRRQQQQQRHQLRQKLQLR